MNITKNELILIGVVVVGGILILNSVDNTITTASNDTGNLITTAAPWALAGIVAWGLFL